MTAKKTKRIITFLSKTFFFFRRWEIIKMKDVIPKRKPTIFNMILPWRIDSGTRSEIQFIYSLPTASRQILINSLAFKEAPPTNTPSISGW